MVPLGGDREGVDVSGEDRECDGKRGDLDGRDDASGTRPKSGEGDHDTGVGDGGVPVEGDRREVVCGQHRRREEDHASAKNGGEGYADEAGDAPGEDAHPREDDHEDNGSDGVACCPGQADGFGIPRQVVAHDGVEVRPDMGD